LSKSSRIDEAETRLGTRLGNYALKEIIGRGGMGVVYRATHIYIRKQVAVKVLYRHLFDNPDAKQRFLHEAQAASLIDHPNVVNVTDFGESPDGTVFLVMNLVEGESMEQLLRREHTLPLFRALVILSQAARAVGAAHANKVIHRDLKPENIMLQHRTGRREIVRTVQDGRGTLEYVEPEGAFDLVTVLDFGAAKIWGPGGLNLDEEGIVVATPYYMAPETAENGYADVRSDIYALGVMLYRTLTGVMPFDGDSPREVMLKHVNWAPLPPTECNPNVEITPIAERVILKALAKRPDDRHQTMEELYADLQRGFGTTRFRRPFNTDSADAPAPSRPAAPLQLRERKSSGEPVPSTATPSPVMRDASQIPAAPAARPLLLTKRKSTDRHKTLPFGAGTVPPAEATPGPETGFERHRTQPYVPSPQESAQNRAFGNTPAPWPKKLR
jgi:serine/threonine protein kinase